MPTVSPVQEEVEQWTGEQEKIREYSEHMRPVFGHEEKSQDREKGAENESSEIIHRNGLWPQADDRSMEPLLHIGVRRVLLHHAVRVEEGRVERNRLPHDLTPSLLALKEQGRNHSA
mgnify:CR=1 FL=1